MNRFIGAILLVAGTATGAGMLALPIVTREAGFCPALLLLFLAWAFLFSTSLVLLDVTLTYKGSTNLITMAENSLGKPGKIACWILYLALLYSLNAAYISALPAWLLIPAIPFIYFGTTATDKINRPLMAGLIISFLLMLRHLSLHFYFPNLCTMHFPSLLSAVPVVITSFGFHIIIPSLTTYLHHDRKALRLALLIGSLIPLFIYILWECLALAATCELPNSSLFSLFAIITSFLGVSLALTDFLKDGLHIRRRELPTGLALIPPLLITLLTPNLFLSALNFAGAIVALLLCLLPALMAWRLYKQKLPLIIIILLSLFVISLDIL